MSKLLEDWKNEIEANAIARGMLIGEGYGKAVGMVKGAIKYGKLMKMSGDQIIEGIINMFDLEEKKLEKNTD